MNTVLLRIESECGTEILSIDKEHADRIKLLLEGALKDGEWPDEVNDLLELGHTVPMHGTVNTMGDGWGWIDDDANTMGDSWGWIDDEDEESDDGVFLGSVEREARLTVRGKYNIIDRAVKELDIKHCVWSMGNEISLESNYIIRNGPCRFNYDGGWGEPVKGIVIDTPRYHDLFLAADRAVRISGDEQHKYLEKVESVGDENGVKVFKLEFGS